VYEENKAEIKRVLAAAPELIHIAFDGWRSNNRHALYGIICYLLNTFGHPEKLVLGLPELAERHSGGNIAAHVIEVLKSYNITNKVGYFTLDNASNNDTAMEEIGKALGFMGKTQRLRCFGHILNLAVKALLFGHDSEVFEDDEGKEALDSKLHELWRRKGPVGKLHNLVLWIHRSDLLTNLLRSLQLMAYSKSDDPTVRAKKPLDVITDVVTRWLSTLYMI
jgi:hypothetical protein